MANEVDDLIRWVYDIKRILRSRVDALKDDLLFDDQEVREKAEKDVEQLLGWFLPSLGGERLREAKEAARQRIARLLEADGDSAEMARKIAGSTASRVRGRGRPRERAQDAMQALGLKLRTGKTWREITLEVIGACEQRKCGSYCSICDDVARPSIPGRLDRVDRLRPRCKDCGFTVRSESQKQPVCHKCADQIRKLAEELGAVMSDQGILPPLLHSDLPLEKIG